jgi:predicted metal-binding protein
LHPEDRLLPFDGIEMPQDNSPQLYICVSCRCRGAEAAPEGEPTDGNRLYAAVLSELASSGDRAPVHVLPTLCFANCERGCNVGIAAPGKWSYLMGELGPEHASDLLAYAAAYAAAKSGVVLPSGRPASLQKTVIARFPTHLAPIKGAAE